MAILYGVGVGPGDPELMTLKAVRILAHCKNIALPQSNAGEIVAYNIAAQAVDLTEKYLWKLQIPMTRDKEILKHSYSTAAHTIMDLLDKGEDVAFLTLGDPSIYSTYIYIQKIVAAKGYSCQMIAGVPSFCAVAARLGESLTERSEPLHLVPVCAEGLEEALSWRGTKVLMKAGKSIASVQEQLRTHGCTDAKMVEKCGMDGEKIYRSLEAMEKEASYFSVIVIKESKVF